MKIKLTWAIVALLFAGLFVSCKNNDDDADLVGNWVEEPEFDGRPRANAVSFVIDGKAYMVGGYDGKDYFNDTWEYNPEDKQWRQQEAFPGTPRTSAVGFAVNGKGYMGTGSDGDLKLKDMWEFNPTGTPQWVQKADFDGKARYGALAFSVGDFGFLGTGYTDDGAEKDMWKYNPADDSWTQVSSLAGSKRYYATVFVINNIAYILNFLSRK